MKYQIKSEDSTDYNKLNAVSPSKVILACQNDTIKQALEILESRLKKTGPALNSPTGTKNYLKIQFAELEQEVFGCLWLDTRHRVIEFEEMFKGTIDGCSVPSREVIKSALQHNAAAVILAHNHPSGNPEPSSADRQMTDKIKEALDHVDIKLIDHIVVGGVDTVSFSDRGWL